MRERIRGMAAMQRSVGGVTVGEEDVGRVSHRERFDTPRRWVSMRVSAVVEDPCRCLDRVDFVPQAARSGGSA